ncbi:MAG: endonuclease Q family protein [Patescibacteria group bacterium]
MELMELMELVCDLEIHTKYARACSKESDLPHHHLWARKKGIDVVGTGDFTHPQWFDECGEQLEDTRGGLYRLKQEYRISQRTAFSSDPLFMYTSEVACIFSRDRSVRRVHVLLFAPSREAAERLNASLEKIGKLGSDGRPILGLDMIRLVELAKEADPQFLIVPAHVWTPWFGMYGSKSGFDSFPEAWGAVSGHVPAVETGLSSDPPMNWRLSELDTKTIISFSDAHSPPNLGREATVVEVIAPTFTHIIQALQSQTGDDRILETLEFFPEEGMYHYDGHRACEVRWSPQETKKKKGICTKCGRPVTVGVLNRVEELADREEGFTPRNRPAYRSLVPLPEMISEGMELGKHSKAVSTIYETFVGSHASEFDILMRKSLDELKSFMDPVVVRGIERMRNGEVRKTPGYDGVYGRVEVFTDEDRKQVQQGSLF